MRELAVFFRTLKLYAHSAHNLCDGAMFFEDHEYFKALYEEYDTAYDDLVERIIGLYGKDSINLLDINIMAADGLKDYPMKVTVNGDFFSVILTQEEKVCSHITELMKVPKVTEGSKNLLQQLADDSERRQYKIKQRLGR